MSNCYWPYQDGKFVVHFTDLKSGREVATRPDCSEFNLYIYPDRSLGMDVVITRRYLGLILRIKGMRRVD